MSSLHMSIWGSILWFIDCPETLNRCRCVCRDFREHLHDVIPSDFALTTIITNGKKLIQFDFDRACTQKGWCQKAAAGTARWFLDSSRGRVPDTFYVTHESVSLACLYENLLLAELLLKHFPEFSKVLWDSMISAVEYNKPQVLAWIMPRCCCEASSSARPGLCWKGLAASVEKKVSIEPTSAWSNLKASANACAMQCACYECAPSDSDSLLDDDFFVLT